MEVLGIMNQFIENLVNIEKDDTNSVNNIICTYHQQSEKYKYDKIIMKVDEYLSSNWKYGVINTPINIKLIITSLKSFCNQHENPLNYHIIPSVHKLIEELSTATNEKDIATHINNYYYKIRYNQQDDVVHRVRICLEKQGWNWINLKLFRYPNLQLLIANLKVICPVSKQSAEFCKYLEPKNNVKDNDSITNLNITITINNLIQNLREERQHAVSLYKDGVDKNIIGHMPIILEMNECLRQYGYNWDTNKFFGAPNLLLLIDDIEKIKNKYFYTSNVKSNYTNSTSSKYTTTTNTFICKKHSTIRSIIDDLIIDLTNKKSNAINYYNNSVLYYQLQEKPIIVEMRNLLTKHGWYWWDMRFITLPKYELLIEDIQKCIDNYQNIDDALTVPDGPKTIPTNFNDVLHVPKSTPTNYFNENYTKKSTIKVNNYDKDYETAIQNSLDITTKKKPEVNHVVNKIILTLSESMFESLDSKFTNCFTKFCESIDNKKLHHHDIIIDINLVLNKHLWHWHDKNKPNGFYSEPNRQSLIMDIQNVIERYDINYDIDSIMKEDSPDIIPKSTNYKIDPDGLLHETINNLVTGLYSSISLNAPVNKFHEMIEFMSNQNEPVVVEINKILTKYGWSIPLKRFPIDPDQGSLICDIQDIIEKYT